MKRKEKQKNEEIVRPDGAKGGISKDVQKE